MNSVTFLPCFYFQVQKTCAGKDLLGVQFCTEGKFPDLASLRLQQIPVLPTIGQTEVYVYMEPAADKPTCINFTNTIEKNDIKGEKSNFKAIVTLNNNKR